MKQYILIGIAAFAVAVIGKYFLLSSDSAPATDTNAQLPALQLSLQEPCNLHEAACIAGDGAGHSIRFSISPNTIPLMQDLQVSAETTGLETIHAARLTVEGVNMFMGYQYADMQADGTGKLNGKLILPVCSMEKMQWKASLEVSAGNKRLLANFPFETVRK